MHTKLGNEEKRIERPPADTFRGVGSGIGERQQGGHRLLDGLIPGAEKKRTLMVIAQQDFKNVSRLRSCGRQLRDRDDSGRVDVRKLTQK